MNVSIEEAVEILMRTYKAAKKDKHILKPVSYALYQTWKAIDQLEKNRS